MKMNANDLDLQLFLYRFKKWTALVARGLGEPNVN
jgi:hypothetical protein